MTKILILKSDDFFKAIGSKQSVGLKIETRIDRDGNAGIERT
jgi:hypothetical protein